MIALLRYEAAILLRSHRWIFPLIAYAALVAAGMAFLDTDPGHRLIVDRIAAIAPKSGLRIRIGRIDGSIWGRVQLRDVRVYDPQGLFLSAPDVRLNWTPWAWTVNRLDISALTAPAATLHTLPKLLPGKGPTLPRFDIRIGRFRIDRLKIAQGIAGPERVGAVDLSADIRDGRAMVKGGAWTSAGDRLRLLLDAAPDRGRFDLGARLSAPVGGMFGKLLRATRPIEAAIAGKGDWAAWNGTAKLNAGGTPLVDTALQVRKGDYRLTGGLFLESVTKGRLQRLAETRYSL